MSPPGACNVRHLFPGERSALLALLADLATDDWHRPTACPGWSVKDVAAHLLADDLGRLSRGRDGHSDPDFAAGLDVSTFAGLVAAIDRQNDRWVRAARRLSPGVLIDLLRFSGEATDAYFATLDLDALGGPVDWAVPDPAPVWLDLGREYTERWVHQQHIRDAVDRPGLKDRFWLHPVLATFAHGLRRALASASAAVGTTVDLTVTGAAGGTWTALKTAAGWVLAEKGEEPAAAAVSLDQETAWRLFTKGIAPSEAKRLAVVDGDHRLADRVFETVAVLA